MTTPANQPVPESDGADTPEYQQFVEDCCKLCDCSNKPCEGVLAGGLCDQFSDESDDDHGYYED